jgi:hypothetical protein
MKPLSFREKVAYIWEYYKIHIFGIIFTAIIVPNLIYSIFIDKPLEIYVGVAWVYDYEYEQISILHDKLTTALVEDPEKEEIVGDPESRAMQARVRRTPYTIS